MVGNRVRRLRRGLLLEIEGEVLGYMGSGVIDLSGVYWRIVGWFLSARLSHKSPNFINLRIMQYFHHSTPFSLLATVTRPRTSPDYISRIYNTICPQ